jgi:peptidoglycan/xylan/chitin deacetylase (PgdA/CDA1 family)
MIMVSNKMWKGLSKLSKILGFTNICYKLNKNRKRVIAYHNVIPDRYFDNAVHLAHSIKESDFKKQLDIISRKFSFGLNIDDTAEVTLTFDDGYLNQYAIAQRIMIERGIKGYFFCAGDLLNGKSTLQIDKSQYWFSYVPKGIYDINLASEIMQIHISDKEGRWTAMKEVLSLARKKVSMEQIEKGLNETYPFAHISGIEEEYYNLRFTPIPLDKINEMKANGHMIGAHSASHKNLSTMSVEELAKDISICSKMLGGLYNTEFFCYPFGGERDISEQVIDKIRKSGFSGAFGYTNIPLKGTIRYCDYYMPRIILSNTVSEEMIDFILSGAMYFILYRKLLPKWH